MRGGRLVRDCAGEAEHILHRVQSHEKAHEIRRTHTKWDADRIHPVRTEEGAPDFRCTHLRDRIADNT